MAAIKKMAIRPEETGRRITNKKLRISVWTIKNCTTRQTAFKPSKMKTLKRYPNQNIVRVLRIWDRARKTLQPL